MENNIDPMLEAALERIKSMSVYKFRPHKQQEEFYKDALNPNGPKLLMAAGGNNTGKSLLCCALAAQIALDYGGRTIYMLTTSLRELSNTIWNYLMEDAQFMVNGVLQEALIPRDFVKDIGYFGSKATNEWSIIHLTNGSKIIGKSYEQASSALKGFVADYLIMDEHPSATCPPILGQLRMRLSKTKFPEAGRLFIASTYENDCSEEFITLRYDLEGNKIKDGKIYTLTFDKVEHLSEERKKQVIESIPENERVFRIHGGMAVAQGKCINVQESNLIDPDELVKLGIRDKFGGLCSHIMPEIGIDPGGAKSLFAAMLVGTDLRNGTKYILDEFCQPNQTPRTMTKAIVRMLKEWRISPKGGLWRFTIDPGGDGTPLGSVRQAFTEEFMSLGIESKVAGTGLISAHKVDRDNSCRTMNDMFKMGIIYVLKHCYRFIKGANHFQYDEKTGKMPKKSPFDDAVHAARYAILTPGGPYASEDLIRERMENQPRNKMESAFFEFRKRILEEGTDYTPDFPEVL